MYDDKELKEYRDLLPPPDHFEEGFDWKTIIGAVFIGFLMMPGSMYLQLVIGQGIGPAARWVTIILFAEIAKRAHSELKQQEIFLLYYMAGAALASPFSGLLWNQYLVQSDAARMLGLTEYIPTWVAPGPESMSMIERTFLHRDWMIPILLLVGSQIIQRIDQFGLGYALFRITSDVEKLPFPMAPVAALGTMALAESTEEKKSGWKWRGFFHRRRYRAGIRRRLRTAAGCLGTDLHRGNPSHPHTLDRADQPYRSGAPGRSHGSAARPGTGLRRHGAALLGSHWRTHRTAHHHRHESDSL